MTGLYPFCHTTKEGVQLYLEEMDDNHLLNTISFFLDRLELADSILRDGINSTASAKFSVNPFTPEKAEAFMEICFERLPSYIFECGIRGLSTEFAFIKISSILCRNCKVSRPKELPFLF